MKIRLVLILMAIPAAFAQSSAPAEQAAQDKHKAEMFYMRVPGPGMAEHTFDFVASEFSFDGNVVKNAPYSAEAVTEMTQHLADGNRIATKSTANLYRDNEGRTRREEKLGAIGPWSSNTEPAPTVFINDPVANTNLVLDSRNKIARKMPSPKIQFAPSTGASGDVAMMKMKVNAERHMTISRAGVTGEPNMIFSSTMQMPPGKAMEGNANKESLGTQTIEGVRAEGTRTTFTIPAGSIGNDRPIEIVSERWYSPELQTVVMTKRNDPRMGETVYRLSNISRTEPSRSLFEAPSDYTVEDAKPFVMKSKD